MILLVCCLCSCDRYYYKPNGVNAPLLAAAKDAHFSANESLDSKAANISIAYSPINHLGIIGNYSTFSYKADKADASTGNVDAHAHLGELGAGYYYAYGSKVKFVGDIYGGAGGGALQSDVNMHFFRSFFQPGVGLRTPYFEIAFNYRFSDIHYRDMDANGHDLGYLQEHNLVYGNKSITGTSYIFGEPSLTLRGGYKFMKLQWQMVSTHAISKVPWMYNDSQMNLGVSFELEDLLALTKTKPKS